MSFQTTKRDAIMLDLGADQLHTGLFLAQESRLIKPSTPKQDSRAVLGRLINR